MNQYNNNETIQVPYMGGSPVRCPRCSNVVNNRLCDFCGLDLSTVYFKTEYKQPAQPPQSPYPNQYQQPSYGQQSYGQQSAYGQQPPYMYNYPQKPHKNHWWILGVVILTMACCFYLLLRLMSYSFGYINGVYDRYKAADDSFSPPNSQEEYYFAGGVSSEEFKRIKNDMSYAQVSSIIGGDGEVANEGENLQGETFYTYSWYGEYNANAIIYITITSDKVTDITLEGNL
ncbi:MAG: hypothetical protein WAX04_13875 [Oscillospiraceae bacterium]